MRLRRVADALMKRVHAGDVAFSGELNESRYARAVGVSSPQSKVHLHPTQSEESETSESRTFLLQNAANGSFAVKEAEGTDEERLARAPTRALAKSHFIPDGNVFELELNSKTSIISGIPTEFNLGLGNPDSSASSPVTWRSLRAMALGKPIRDVGLAGRAGSLMAFRRANKYCSGCGKLYHNPSNFGDVSKETCLICQDCGLIKWPRANPCAIVLVESASGDGVLLGRGTSWMAGRFSTLAGFCDPSESIEHCCIREVREEAGVNVDPSTVLLAASQPWPVSGLIRPNHEPAVSLMISCFARAVDAKAVPKPDGVEVEEARFFSADELRQIIQDEKRDAKSKGGLSLPPRGAVSRSMIESWLEVVSTDD